MGSFFLFFVGEIENVRFWLHIQNKGSLYRITGFFSKKSFQRIDTTVKAVSAENWGKRLMKQNCHLRS